MIEAAFTVSGGSMRWTGGINYLRNCLRVLRAHESSRVHPRLFVAPEVPAADRATLAAELDGPPIEAPWLGDAQRGRRMRSALLTGRDALAATELERHGIDVVFEAGEFFGTRTAVPALAWVADFQSHHLPQFFSWRARWRTSLGRRLQLRGRRIVMLSSRDAEGDCLRFYPASRGRTVVVPFAVPQKPGMAPDPTVPAHHGLPARYFYLPNQFWRHKNHVVIVEALARARDAGTSMVVAASGSPEDHRNPGHLDSLKARIVALGLEESFRILGLIPFEHVSQLALQSVALVNPSLFEGWSTTVEEAKSLGVPLVLSGLAVHREQTDGAARYFDPHSPDDAASALVDAWSAPPGDPAQRLAGAAASAARRVREFAGRLADAFELAARA